jgi:DNA repair exonuclease SbcCD ATPase subunit
MERSPAVAEPEMAALPQTAPNPSMLAFGGAGVAAIAGVVLIALGQAVAGIALLAAGAAIGIWIARGRTATASVPDVRGTAERHAQALTAWDADATRLRDAAQHANEGLRAALAARGALTEGDARAALAAYELDCAGREDAARAAAGAEGLRRAIEARHAAEDAARRVESAAADTEDAIRAAAEHIGEAAEDVDTQSAVERLLAWQRTRSELAAARETSIREWQELQGLLAGGTLAELQAESGRRAQVAARLARRIGDDAVIPVAGDSEAALAAARAEASRSKAVVDELSGELRLLATTLADVAEAEERAGAATIELGRVQNLAAVIDETLTLLEAAERRVHRDVAPVLTASVQRHLPAITGGAYLEVGMNPRDLSVDVKEASTGQWRDARLLSEGTREQIYLLLRVAMAEHLVTTDESAPLLLDEVTAQSDPERKLRMLDVLHALSADRQIVLFSHDAEVMEWAALALREPRDRLIRLGVAVPAQTTTPLAEAAIG